MQIEWTSFGFGVATGVALLAAFKLHGLRSMRLELEKIGLGLGIEGFEPPQRGGVQVGDISGSTGDIVSGDKAGGNINKTTTIEKADVYSVSQSPPPTPAPGVADILARRWGRDTSWDYLIVAFDRDYPPNHWPEVAVERLEMFLRDGFELQSLTTGPWHPRDWPERFHFGAVLRRPAAERGRPRIRVTRG